VCLVPIEGLGELVPKYIVLVHEPSSCEISETFLITTRWMLIGQHFH